MNWISLGCPGILHAILILRKGSPNAVAVVERIGFTGRFTMSVWKCPHRLIIVSGVEHSRLLRCESIVLILKFGILYLYLIQVFWSSTVNFQNIMAYRRWLLRFESVWLAHWVQPFAPIWPQTATSRRASGSQRFLMGYRHLWIVRRGYPLSGWSCFKALKPTFWRRSHLSNAGTFWKSWFIWPLSIYDVYLCAVLPGNTCQLLSLDLCS